MSYVSPVVDVTHKAEFIRRSITAMNFYFGVGG